MLTDKRQAQVAALELQQLGYDATVHSVAGGWSIWITGTPPARLFAPGVAALEARVTFLEATVAALEQGCAQHGIYNPNPQRMVDCLDCGALIPNNYLWLPGPRLCFRCATRSKEPRHSYHESEG